MFKISIKSHISIIISKIILKLSKTLFKGGTNFPGKVALKLDPNILKVVAKDYKIILVTGTNGKTTTTSMIYNMIKDTNNRVITNNTGANMLPGIVSCFIDNFKLNNINKTEQFAVIETDEANVKLVTEFICPEIITVTNLFRDQLDRYGEVYTTLKKILEGIEKAPFSTLILNGDESLLGELPLPNRTIYYGFNYPVEKEGIIDINADAKFCKKCKTPYKYNFLTYNHLGDFYCENCGYKRPNLTFALEEIKELTPEGSNVIIDSSECYINQPGIYNIYNALCAYSIGRILNIDKNTIFNSLRNQKSSFGRQETLNIDGKEVKIILVKNPAGYDQAISTLTLDSRNMNIVTLLNDNYADGRDVSWIWDVKFEKLCNLNIDKIMISGIRLYDMAVRLKVAGLPDNRFVLCENYDSLLEEIKTCQSNTVYILATYTAMIDFRKYLYNKNYINKLW
ncbi:UDP-N-acetylmuramyl tripeptide synthase [Clostridium tetanomorphum]|uniref:Lipid II isoglutaminyl synthase (glutamine-hydrolyzing) subunit MurT n=1 Tax=Clostridium tetanomorphum TaxID=1553 RepID=A0A923E8E5_CLOTT|nr:Mur ligase family protein [Clostridium tetanomorphum]KAJ50895.1 putative UDP-N-acetylmuramyl tripeptide synthetase [Clostridium tetanomorphum DSM 665]MBC2397147.1 Mur ligase family protein [Clostridium tetanomorphum]MBP1863069.1 UDP-N-acetylmuramyl tripeptide synthase [Clostridium tetanomorphum]NRS82898.1 UDP-N-acetylmuramyl tripeptide synthase [Clostridium tetanomorphum]NRZ99006.1 UDP-N-acetylmuramyl tripeptide synthase [Clostridium tetanomorphum]